MTIPIVPNLLRDHLSALAQSDERIDGRGAMGGKAARG